MQFVCSKEGEWLRSEWKGRGRGRELEISKQCAPFFYLCAVPDMGSFNQTSTSDVLWYDIITSHSCHELIEISIRACGT